MNKNNIKNNDKLLIFLLVILFILTSFIAYKTFYREYNKKHFKKNKKFQQDDIIVNNGKKAIIIVPGIGCSTLHYLGKTNNKYKHGECIFFRGDFDKWSFLDLKNSALKALSNYNLLACNSAGEGIYKNVGLLENYDGVDPYDIEISKYGFSSMFKNLITYLENKYGKNTDFKYEIFLFNYDWRLDNSYNGERLYKKIKEYDDGVIIIGYSMGNLITSKAAKLLYDDNDIDRIKLFLSTFPVYNGATQAVYFLKTGKIANNTLFNILNKFYKIDLVLIYLSKNYPAMYQLMPTKEFSKRNKGFMIDNDNLKLNYRQSMNYLKKDKNLNQNLINQAIKFHEDLYVNNKHILNYIKNKYFFIGCGFETGDTLKINRNNYKDILHFSYSDGDGTVNYKLSADPPCECDSENIVLFKSNHLDGYKNNDFLIELTDLIDLYVWK